MRFAGNQLVFLQIAFHSFCFGFLFWLFFFYLLKNKARGYTIKKRILSTKFIVWFLIVFVQMSAIRFAIRFAKMRFVVLNIFIYLNTYSLEGLNLNLKLFCWFLKLKYFSYFFIYALCFGCKHSLLSFVWNIAIFLCILFVHSSFV